MSFDALAPHYRWMEFVLAGNKLQRCRTAFLDHVAGAQNVLILGEGNGRFLCECRRKLPEAQITCVDSSARMLALARKRTGRQNPGCEKIEFVFADALDWTPPDSRFDLIVTHFFLDCFPREQLEPLIAKFARTATPRASLLLGDFQLASTGLRRLRSRLILWAMYRFFRVVTRLAATELTSPDIFLERHSFRLREQRLSEWELLRSDWWERTETR
jgi:ubiquinone/menaquinone biosynthesis C-methylase UbiE